jgi:hypothetical protein
MAQTDVRDYNGEPLYAEAIVRPSWYWNLRRLKLFLSIVWRKWDEGYRLSISTAWSVSEVAKGLTGR